MTTSAETLENTRHYKLAVLALHPRTTQERWLLGDMPFPVTELAGFLRNVAKRLRDLSFPDDTILVVTCESESMTHGFITAKFAVKLSELRLGPVFFAQSIPDIYYEAVVKKALADTTAEQNRISQNTTISPEHIIKALDGG